MCLCLYCNFTTSSFDHNPSMPTSNLPANHLFIIYNIVLNNAKKKLQGICRYVGSQPACSAYSTSSVPPIFFFYWDACRPTKQARSYILTAAMQGWNKWFQHLYKKGPMTTQLLRVRIDFRYRRMDARLSAEFHSY